jgi:O-antigen ligase
MWATSAGMILVALSFSQIAYALHPRKGPFIGYLEVLSVLVLLAWAVQVLASGRLRTLRWPPWPLGAALAVAVLSLSAAAHLSAGLLEISQYVLYFIALYVFFSDVFSRRTEYAWWALIVGSAGAGLIALLQLPSGDVKLLRGLAGSAYLHSAYMAVVLPLAFAWICAGWGRRWAAGAALGLLLAAATLVGSPHVWILLPALVWVARMVQPARSWRGALLVGLPLLVLQFASPLHRAANLDSFLNPWETGNVYKLLSDVGAGEDLSLVKKRWLELYPALAMIADRPLLGVGTGNYQFNIGRADYWGSLPNAKKTEPDTNNLYLVVAATMGLAGLAVLVAMLYYPWRLAASAASRGDPLAVGLTAALAVLAVVIFFTPLLVRGAAVGWCALMALAALRAGEVVPRAGKT